MTRTLSVLLIGLFVLVVLAAPRPAAAQLGYGPKPRIISVRSYGSRGVTETIAAGQWLSSLDHGGPWLDIWVWIPAASTVYERLGDWLVTLERSFSPDEEQRLPVKHCNVVRSGATALGWTICFSADYYYFTNGFVRFQEVDPTQKEWGRFAPGYRGHHILMLQ